MSQIYFELPSSYYPWKLVLNDNLKKKKKKKKSGIPIPRTVNR